MHPTHTHRASIQPDVPRTKEDLWDKLTTLKVEIGYQTGSYITLEEETSPQKGGLYRRFRLPSDRNKYGPPPLPPKETNRWSQWQIRLGVTDENESVHALQPVLFDNLGLVDRDPGPNDAPCPGSRRPCGTGRSGRT